MKILPIGTNYPAEEERALEQLKYIIEDRTIAALLGEQNFTNKESAVLELVKNAYDAGATLFTLSFEADTILVSDNGSGMDASDIKQNWMHVGKSDKDYDTIDFENHPRVLAGSKGIGRFALARLGEMVTVFSRKQDPSAQGVRWSTDWNTSSLSQDCTLTSPGTKIEIRKLRDKWTKKAVEKLLLYLSRTYNDTLMEIRIKFDGKENIVAKYYSKPCLGQNCKTFIALRYDSYSHTLHTSIISDEFLEEAQERCAAFDIHKHYSQIDILQEFDASTWDMTTTELEEHLIDLGDFTGEFFFNVASSSFERAKFLYKYGILPISLEGGIVLYRNAFSISAYEGTKDWLGLGKRSRKSPAAASHPTGSWRVRENQLSGKIEIDKRRNYRLQDLSNRQGLDENVYYDLFVEIILSGLKEFERYRQGIVREIDAKNEAQSEIRETPVSDRVIKDPKSLATLSVQETKQLVAELRTYKKESSQYQKNIESTEQQYKYDVRILNVLATTGLKAASIAHEMKNDRNFIADSYDSIVSALKQYGLWELLSSPEKTDKSYRNIPYLLSNSDEINKKLIAFMDTMLEEIEKRQFEPSWQSIADILSKEKQVWERDYSWITININLEDDICFYISEDIIRVILDNLILNSVQQNSQMNHLEINIGVESAANQLFFKYSDGGKGLDKKYHHDPFKILEVHETTRKNGHGLGMWIINNTVKIADGEVLDIGCDGGFSISFSLGGKIQ